MVVTGFVADDVLLLTVDVVLPKDVLLPEDEAVLVPEDTLLPVYEVVVAVDKGVVDPEALVEDITLLELLKVFGPVYVDKLFEPDDPLRANED